MSVGDARPATGSGNRMRNVDRYFVCLGVLAGLAGLSLGSWMHFHDSYALLQVHAHTNLVGWVTMMLFGLAYRSGLARKDGWAVAHFWVAAGGVAALPTGMVIAMLGGPTALVDAGAILTVASMVLFCANVLRALEFQPAEAKAVRRDPAAVGPSALAD
jgi:hypothetical protein